MPTVDIASETEGANGKAVDWAHISTIIAYLETLMNTTGFNHINIASNGIRPGGIRSHDAILHNRTRVWNSTGGSLAKGDLIYFGTLYNDGTDKFPNALKAIAADTDAANFYAYGFIEAAIADAAEGVAITFGELTDIDTSGKTVGDPVYLDTTAGGYTYTMPSPNNRVQIVGYVTNVDASAGRIMLCLPGIVVPYSIAEEVEA